MIKIRHLHIVVASVMLMAGGAEAQTPQSQTPQPQTPQRTTASYEDWVVRCETRGTTKICEMAQAMQIQGQAQPITQIAIGQQSKGTPVKIVFQVPINVWLPAGAKLVVNEKDPGIFAAYDRCLPGTCLAEAELKEDQIKKLRGASENGKLQFKDGAQQDVVIPVSFKGFEQAYQAMQQP
jgi:invasion protein IalB